MEKLTYIPKVRVVPGVPAMTSHNERLRLRRMSKNVHSDNSHEAVMGNQKTRHADSSRRARQSGTCRPLSIVGAVVSRNGPPKPCPEEQTGLARDLGANAHAYTPNPARNGLT